MKETVLGLNKDMKFYFCPEYVNMQKGIDSLCGFIRSNLMRDPFSNEVFIFMGRNKKQIKILRWDEDKFILYTVKLYNLNSNRQCNSVEFIAVSYTHLTLPTKLEV